MKDEYPAYPQLEGTRVMLVESFYILQSVSVVLLQIYKTRDVLLFSHAPRDIAPLLAQSKLNASVVHAATPSDVSLILQLHQHAIPTAVLGRDTGGAMSQRLKEMYSQMDEVGIPILQKRLLHYDEQLIELFADLVTQQRS